MPAHEPNSLHRFLPFTTGRSICFAIAVSLFLSQVHSDSLLAQEANQEIANQEVSNPESKQEPAAEPKGADEPKAEEAKPETTAESKSQEPTAEVAKAEPKTEEKNAQSADAWLKNFKWREVGPTATGGRVIDIEVDPTNAHHIFVASAAGGLWETINNGTTWNCIFENENSTSIGDIAIDPKDPKTIWIGSGEANNQRSSLAGDGIYKTTDGGKTWKNMGLGDTQHIGRVIIDPNDSNTVFVAAIGHLYTFNDERGVFKTTDGGATWKKVLFVDSKTGVIDIAIHPKDSKILLAASYQRLRKAWDFDGNGPGSGIYRSADGGETWARIESNLPTGDIGRIGVTFFNDDPNIAYATVSNQNKRETTDPEPNEEPGDENDSEMSGEEPGESEVYNEEGYEENESVFELPESEQDPQENQVEEAEAKSDTEQDKEDDDADSIDSRFDFRLKSQVSELKDSQSQNLQWVVSQIKPRSNAAQQGLKKGDLLVSLAGIENWEAESLKAFVRSIKQGDRINWQFRRNEQTDPISLSLQVPPAAELPEIGGQVYRSEDAGQTWTLMNKRPAGGEPPYYYGQIRIDPKDANRIYMLSVPVLVSSDGGKTFKTDGAPSVHVDHHALWINPDNSNHLMLGNDGGFHISYDRGKTWDYVFNIPLAQFYAITADNQIPYHVYGGLQDNGSWGGPSEATGGVSRESWYRVGGGDGFYVQVDPNDHNIIFSESQFGVLGRQNRETGERAFVRPPQTDAENPDRVADRYNWNSPILMSKHDPRTIYFGGNKLFMSYNRGDDWLTISPDLTTNDPAKTTGNVPHCTITTIAESALDKNWLVVGTDDGKVQLTRDRGKHWEDISSGFPIQPNRWWCSRVEFSHADLKTIYVSFTGYREDDFRAFVFKSTDAGESWNSIAGNLPDENINVIKQDPKAAATLYVGTEKGVFVSLNDGKQWHPIGGIPRVSVQDLLVHPRDRDLVIGTHGRGIYILDEINPLQERADWMNNRKEDQKAHLYSINNWYQVRTPSVDSFAGDRKRVTTGPDPGVTIWYEVVEGADMKDAKLIVKNEAGQTVATLKTESEAGLHKTRFPEARGGGRGFFGGRGRRGGGQGPTGPGKYTVELTVGDKTETQTFEIIRQ